MREGGPAGLRGPGPRRRRPLPPWSDRAGAADGSRRACSSQAQQVQARAVVAKYPTVADAVAAGYRESTVYVPCIGAHYTNTSLAIGFNPSAPSELLYARTRPDSHIVGLSYLVYHPGGAPEGFAGTNDHWHQHTFNGGLCIAGGGIVVGAESTSVADCDEAGRQEDRADRHLDAARLGDAGIRVLVGRLRLGVSRARRQDRPRRLALTAERADRRRSVSVATSSARTRQSMQRRPIPVCQKCSRRTGEPEGGDDLAGRAPRDRVVRLVATHEAGDRASRCAAATNRGSGTSRSRGPVAPSPVSMWDAPFTSVNAYSTLLLRRVAARGGAPISRLSRRTPPAASSMRSRRADVRLSSVSAAEATSPAGLKPPGPTPAGWSSPG